MIKAQWLRELKNDKKRICYLLAFLCCGILLMVFPMQDKENRENNAPDDSVMNYSVEKEEQRLEKILSAINGVGECKVLLSVHNGGELILAEDDGKTVVLSESGKQSTVTVRTQYPMIQGAVIVSGGCDNTSVRYDILSSVMAYTGLTVDRITICPMKHD